MPSRAVKIIDDLYGEELRRKRRWAFLGLFRKKRRRPMPLLYANKPDAPVVDLYQERNRALNRARVLVLAGVGLTLFLVGLSIYYFNILTTLEQDVFTEQAKVDSLLQRRRDLSVNLAKSVRDYAIHEQGIFNHVSNMRAKPKTDASEAGSPPVDLNAGPADPGDNQASDRIMGDILALVQNPDTDALALADELPGLMAVAENYPDLKLSENFRRFMEALIDTEKDLSQERMKYSEIVNNYTTRLRTFPGRFFGRIYGFQDLPYYEADAEARRFSPIDY